MTANDRLLAFDAAGSACSAAVWAEGVIRARRFESMSRGQSQRLLPLIEEVLREAKLEFADLNALAVTLGPGGFTGVRIGLATARGLALALGLPIIGITSFEAAAAAVATEERANRNLLVVIDSKRRELFVQALAPDLVPLGTPTVAAPEALATLLPPDPVTLAGDGVEAA
ncbi:MAG: tRNA (adenosine(37)-N6)-threonylcarbamoyltransferase complex dimerization subunit type 1 TsaB, partial [Kiloniellales bacterium]